MWQLGSERLSKPQPVHTAEGKLWKDFPAQDYGRSLLRECYFAAARVELPQCTAHIQGPALLCALEPHVLRAVSVYSLNLDLHLLSRMSTPQPVIANKVFTVHHHSVTPSPHVRLRKTKLSLISLKPGYDAEENTHHGAARERSRHECA